MEDSSLRVLYHHHISHYLVSIMPIKIAINGFGRIGRSVLRSIYASADPTAFEIVAINELAPIEQISHLLQYDSVYGKFNEQVTVSEEAISPQLVINNHAINLYQQKDPESLPWNALGVDMVFECTGQFNDRETLSKHLNAGAKKVLLSQPGDEHMDATIIFGFNHQQLTQHHCIVSNASCTSNCLIPVLQILQDKIGIQSGNSTTIHSAMSDQPVNDGYASRLRLTRSAIPSIIPITTQLSIGVEKLMPQLKGKFTSSALRVPTINVSMLDVDLLLEKDTTIEEIHQIFNHAAQQQYLGIVDTCNLPLVSMDYNKNPSSVIVDLTQTQLAANRQLKLMLWFDNEWGFANRMLDTAVYWCSLK